MASKKSSQSTQTRSGAKARSGKRRQLRWKKAVAILLVVWAGVGHEPAQAIDQDLSIGLEPGQQLTSQDCEAAGRFIRDSALARDRGVSAAAMLAKLQADMFALGSEPPEQRWFLHGPAEAAMLYGATRSVHAQPQDPLAHYTGFVQVCEQHRADAQAARLASRHP